jgi:hypothetical protein
MTEEDVSKFSWARKQNENEARSPPITLFVEVMSEELANELQEVCFRNF